MSRTPRVYVDRRLKTGDEISADPAVERHLIKVLRLRPGASMTVFDGRGVELAATLAQRRGRAVLCLGEPVPVVAEPATRVCLIQGISRGERMDLVVQKGTELGVTELRPVFTERSVVRLDEKRTSRRLAHWRSIVIAACEQCGRATLPEIHPPQNLESALGSLDPSMTRLMLDAQSGSSSLPAPVSQICLLVGPEGGLSDREKQLARTTGFLPLTLGPRIMRTETAALAALAVAQWLWGDLSAR